MNMENTIFDNDKKYIANTYGRFPVAVKSGKGSIIYDVDGKRYKDMGSGIATNAFGLCDDEWNKAITDQLGEYAHVSNLYYSEPQIKLAKLLCVNFNSFFSSAVYCSNVWTSNQNAICAKCQCLQDNNTRTDTADNKNCHLALNSVSNLLLYLCSSRSLVKNTSAMVGNNDSACSSLLCV